MKHSKYKAAVIALFVVISQVTSASAQRRTKDSRESKTVTIDLKGLESEITSIFRTVAHEISKVDMREVGSAIEEIGREIGDIKVVVDPEMEDENLELISTENKSRTISRSYKVDKSDKLAIINQYGNVVIKTWEKNEIKVDIEINAYESSASAAQDLLESVKVEEGRQADLISYKTVFNKVNNNFWRKVINGKEERRGVQINYNVYMPAGNALDIKNTYGNTSLEDLKGQVNINSTYGNISGSSLDNAANQIRSSYGTVSMVSFSNGNINVNYGQLKLDRAEKISATITYSPVTINRLNTGGTFNVTYGGGLKIAAVDKDVKNLVVNSTYAGVTLGLDKSANIDYDVTVVYNNFNFDRNKDFQNSLVSSGSGRSFNPTKKYRGTLGEGSDSRIIVKSTYGAVKFL